MPLSSTHMDNWGVYWAFFDFRWERMCWVLMLEAGAVASLHTNREACRADTTEGAVLPDRKFLKQSTLPSAPWPRLSTGQESMCAQVGVRICLCWDKNIQMNLQQKNLGQLNVYPTFYSGASTGFLKASTRHWGRGMQDGSHEKGLCSVHAFDSFKQLHVPHSPLWPRWWERKKELLKPYCF